MEFIEMTGKTLFKVVDTHEMPPELLREAGVTEDSVVRVNRQGDIELRVTREWEIIGGLIGDFDERVRQQTGLDWA